MQDSRRTIQQATTWLLAIVALSGLVGILNADAPAAEKRPADSTLRFAPQPTGEESPLVKVQATLAEAGCPGWIVLASEGSQALEAPTTLEMKLVPGDVRPTSERVPQSVPTVQYPTTLRVARRLFESPPESGGQLVTASPQADDDLLDGAPDLLSTESIPARPTEEPAGPELAPVEPLPSNETPPSETPPRVEPPKSDALLFEPPTAQPRQPATAGDDDSLIDDDLLLDDNSLPTPVVPTPQPESLPTPPKASPFVPLPPSQSSALHSAPPTTNQPAQKLKTYCEFVADNCYPSAEACAVCHKKLYDEWSVSSHAYAAVSPMFHKFEQKISDLSQGTIGYFCYRCHSPVGTTLGVSRAAPMWSLPQVAREGVTCIACHRVNQRYGKVNGERRIEPGDIHAPVYGSIGGSGVAEAIARREELKLKFSPDQNGPGQDIHVAGFRFDQLSKPEFCVSCHQVAVQPGIKLEVVWEQYRASPACKKGISCQDCHMGRIPGVPSGYEIGAAAEVNGKTVNTHRKHANHVFYGPGYSIAHPGIFPHNPDAHRWSMRDWLLFDYRAGWGTEEFEAMVESGQIRAEFPPVWAEVDDRYDARDVINDNLKKLEFKRLSRQMVLENGSHVDGPFFDAQPVRGADLRLHYVLTNTNEGHNMPSGSLGAQPQLWANAVLVGPRGQRLWESGYTDRWGDVADIHSEDVRHKRIPFDSQLFNLQTMFLITGTKGADREFFLPVNVDFDQLPYLRPGAQPISVINHPPFIRMESRSLAPLGSRKIPYKIPAELLCEPGCYRLSFRMRSRAEPIYFMRFCGSTREMDRAMNEWMVDFHQSSVEFVVR